MQNKQTLKLKNYMGSAYGMPDVSFQSPTDLIERNSDPTTNLNRFIAPVQFDRERQTILTWRHGAKEAELAWFPHRVSQQRLYKDTVLNAYVWGCWLKRRNLTLLRDFIIAGTDDKELQDGKWTKYFKKKWNKDMMTYIIDAMGFGYSLISLGDCVKTEFPNLQLIKRWNVSPDRLNVGRFVYSLAGVKFLEEPYKDWHVWVPTMNEVGDKTCGFGMFYRIGLIEIYLRNLLGQNANFTELFAQPIRHIKTDKEEGPERDALEAAADAMGNKAWIITGLEDQIDFIQGKAVGASYKSYKEFRDDLKKMISLLTLGHEDAITSTPGKLGSGQGGNADDEFGSPIKEAQTEIQTHDGDMVEDIYNGDEGIIAKIRNIGVPIPEGAKLLFKNDAEANAIRRREDKNNAAVTDIALGMSQAGMKMDIKYFTDRTGIIATDIPTPEPPKPLPGGTEKKRMSNRLRNKLNLLYAEH